MSRKANTVLLTYTANLVSRTGERTRYVMQAYSKTEARQKIAAAYRVECPARSGYFLRFEELRLEWVGEPVPSRGDGFADSYIL